MAQNSERERDEQPICAVCECYCGCDPEPALAHAQERIGETTMALARIAELGSVMDSMRMSSTELIDYARRIAQAALSPTDEREPA